MRKHVPVDVVFLTSSAIEYCISIFRLSLEGRFDLNLFWRAERVFKRTFSRVKGFVMHLKLVINTRKTQP